MGYDSFPRLAHGREEWSRKSDLGDGHTERRRLTNIKYGPAGSG